MAEQGFTLSSSDFPSAGIIPRAFTCDDRNAPPRLEWMHPPQGTKSFTLIMDDPDAPHGTFTHWVKFDIPADQRSLRPGGAGVDGKNDFQQDGYGGPCPPANHGEHRYYFRLYALDVEALELKPGAHRDAVLAAIEGHVLDQAELMGRYERKPSS